MGRDARPTICPALPETQTYLQRSPGYGETNRSYEPLDFSLAPSLPCCQPSVGGARLVVGLAMRFLI
jgi:hypothetical protein